MKPFLDYAMERALIAEARSHPELNPKVSMMERLEPYKAKNGYYITYVAVPKVGLYTDNQYWTPYGIYCYPLWLMWDDVANNAIPFASKRSYVALIRHKSGRMLDQSATVADVKRCESVLAGKYGDWVKADDATDFELDPKTRNVSSPCQLIWRMGKMVARRLMKYDKKKFTSKWTSIMRKDLGYAGAQDLNGDGYIHTNEPTQAVFFDPRGYELVSIMDNKRYSDDAFYSTDTGRGMVSPTQDKYSGGMDVVNRVLKALGDTNSLDLTPKLPFMHADQADEYGDDMKVPMQFMPVVFTPEGISAKAMGVHRSGGKTIISNAGLAGLCYVPKSGTSLTLMDCTLVPRRKKNGYGERKPIKGVTLESCSLVGANDVMSKMDGCLLRGGMTLSFQSVMDLVLFCAHFPKYASSNKIVGGFMNWRLLIGGDTSKYSCNPSQYKVDITVKEIAKANPEFSKLLSKPIAFMEKLGRMVESINPYAAQDEFVDAVCGRGKAWNGEPEHSDDYDDDYDMHY